VHVARSGNDVVKKAHELTIDDKANGTEDKSEEKAQEEKKDVSKEKTGAKEKEEPKDEDKIVGEPKVGDKHAREENPIENGTKEIPKDVEMKHLGENTENGAENGELNENGETEEKDGEPLTKKQKTDEDEKGNVQEGEKKVRGRPKKSDSVNGQEPSKKKESKPAATVDGKPRRSSRLIR
jgi:hypothetical protein